MTRLSRSQSLLVVAGYLQAKADSAIFAPDLRRRYQQSADALLDTGEVSPAFEELRSLREGCLVAMKTKPGDEDLKRQLSRLSSWMKQLEVRPCEAVIWLRNQANRLAPAAVSDDYNQAADQLEAGNNQPAIYLIGFLYDGARGKPRTELGRLLRDVRRGT